MKACLVVLCSMLMSACVHLDMEVEAVSLERSVVLVDAAIQLD